MLSLYQVLELEKDKEYDTQVIAHIPIEPSIRVGGDEGKPVVYYYPDSASGKRYLKARSSRVFFNVAIPSL